MFSFRCRRTGVIFGCVFVFCLFGRSAVAVPTGIIHGRVLDPLGATIANAHVTLIRDGKEIGSGSTDQNGVFTLQIPGDGRYSVRAEAPGFARDTSATVFAPSSAETDVNVSLRIGALPQEILVSATGTPIPESQVGASASVIGRQELEDSNHADVLESLRDIPGLQVIQTGQRGGTTSVFVRGGDQDFNKVLIDNIPANDIGGAFEFANLASSGVDEVEILRGPNSVVYGSDALSSVINITTPRGMTLFPEITYRVDGGDFGTVQNDISVGGAVRQFDYFSEFSRFGTDNHLPNSDFNDSTYAGNFGWTASSTTSVRFTLRHGATDLGLPGAMDFYGVPDDSSQREHDTYGGLTLQNQTTDKWRNTARFTESAIRYHFVNPSPTGAPFDPFAGTEFDFGPNFLGNNVTICGANGFCTAGQAILDFSGVYPQPFDSHMVQWSLYGQSDYQVRQNLDVTAGFRYENETGMTDSSGLIASSDRNNYSGFLEGNGNLFRRLYASGGVGLDQNAIFGFAVTPRVSLAYYLRRPSAARFLGATKLKFNFGTGIKEPTIAQENSSLYMLLTGVGGGTAIIGQDAIAPIGPERSRSFDFGGEQDFWNGRARLDATLFMGKYYNLIDFVDANVLPQLGVPSDAAQAAGFGAYINSDSFRSRGAEIQLQIDVAHAWRLRGEYTYLDAVVTQSFTGSALAPAFNSAFPNIPIGAFAPLVSGRPFNRAPQSGSLFVDYTRKRLGVTLMGSFVGRRDGSTFLSDAFEGNSLLLPNRNLQAAYQQMDLSGRYEISRHVEPFFSISNLLNQRNEEEVGYPALPISFRVGMKFTVGGEGGWWK